MVRETETNKGNVNGSPTAQRPGRALAYGLRCESLEAEKLFKNYLRINSLVVLAVNKHETNQKVVKQL